jgi:hypothetical protein
MRPLETVFVEILFGRVDHIPDPDRTILHQRPAAMTERGRRVHLVVARSERHHVLPHVSRQQERVQQY